VGTAISTRSRYRIETEDVRSGSSYCRGSRLRVDRRRHCVLLVAKPYRTGLGTLISESRLPGVGRDQSLRRHSGYSLILRRIRLAVKNAGGWADVLNGGLSGRSPPLRKPRLLASLGRARAASKRSGYATLDRRHRTSLASSGTSIGSSSMAPKVAALYHSACSKPPSRCSIYP
jgi:hypothetical protein